MSETAPTGSGTPKSTKPQPSISTWQEALASSVFHLAKNKLEDVLITFTSRAADECGVDKAQLYTIWNEVAPDCALDIDKASTREDKLRKQELRKLKKDTEASGTRCQHLFGDKSSRSGQECGDVCKDASPAPDGKVYCTRHRRQKVAKRTCEFVYGPKSTDKAGNACGARIAKDAPNFDQEGEYEGKVYAGCSLCKKHTNQVERGLIRNANRCTHFYGDKSSKAGEQCTSIAKEGGKCSKHIASASKGKTKKSLTKDEIKEAKRKALQASETDESKSDETKSADMTLQLEPNFKAEPSAPIWKAIDRVADDGSKFVIWVDLKSGLVAMNYDEQDSSELKPDELQIAGQWDSETQTHVNLGKDGCAYAKKTGIPIYAD